ncbi:hypothetical protein [Deinococcus sp. QL22]|uniref:hypothetical protein n=1 Tax=Deinococcus sp. QL22 TaxID=2939437 RepID=UPI0020172BCE|nr:hypothetical protein [Deinococcus sp. QL22]UQN05680.1 hypothetical protein M1R55_12485 [Deinococcus sp. QL22]
MKPIGVYVAARELPGRAVAPGTAAAAVSPAQVRTLRATDRLTGMPVLVHVLPAALPVPQLPDHPALLPYSDEGMDGEDAYLVTELPLHAVLASDPVLAARGALAGLAALHSTGLIHGGVSTSQLWSVDGRVALAGAGLPWSEGPGSPDDDLRALADALAQLGGVPEPLRALQDSPGTLTALAALARLQASAASGSSGGSGQVNSGQAAAPVHASSAQTLPAQAAAEQVDAEQAGLPAPHDGTPIVLGVADADIIPAPNETDSATSWGKMEGAAVDVAFPHLPDVPVQVGPEPGNTPEPAEQPRPQPVASQPNTSQPNPSQAAPTSPEPRVPVIQIDLTQPSLGQPSSDSSDVPDSGVTIIAVRPAAPPESPPSLPAVSPVSAYSNAPPGVAETPQERRKRQNDERRAQAMQDSRAAAERKAAARREREAAQPAVVQIEFDDLPNLPNAVAASQPTEGTGPRFPTSVNVERVPASMRRAPLPPESPEEPEHRAGQPRTTQEVGRLPGRRTQGEPIRIGWAEDDSWRVVRAPGKAAQARSRALAPRWLLPLLAAIVLLGGAVWAFLTLPNADQPAAEVPCCTVRFTVQGAAGVTARLTVLEAPDGANLTPGQDVGVAPGPVNLPVRGMYRLRVAADGYAPGTLSVTAPTSQPVRIDLGP